MSFAIIETGGKQYKVSTSKILAKGGKVIDEAKIVEKKKVVKETKKDIKKTEKK